MLILIGLLSLLVFAVPVRYKYALTLGVISPGVALAVTGAVTTLAGIPLQFDLFEKVYHPIFRYTFPLMDRLSAVFVLIISVAALSATLYARDYLKAYAVRKSPAHTSVHFFFLVLMYFSMLGVALFRDGFAFLTAWEMMTIASFVLMVFRGEKREVRRAAINYLILMHIGFVFLVAGFVLGAGNGTLGGFNQLGYLPEIIPFLYSWSS